MRPATGRSFIPKSLSEGIYEDRSELISQSNELANCYGALKE